MSFSQQLRRVGFLLRASRVAGVTLAVAGLLALMWLSFGIADFFAAFEAPARVAITTTLAAIGGIVLFGGWLRALHVPAARAARHADIALAASRGPACAALSLDPAAATRPLAAFLATRTLEEAAAQLRSIPLKKLVPWRRLGFAVMALVIPLVIIGILRVSAPGAFATIAQRLMQPSADLPPHSAFQFQLEPARLATVYGGEILITAHVTGATPVHAIECLIRQPRSGEVLRLPAFREAPTRFSRKLDGLTEPIEIAFASGRARSAWHPVEILLQPNILSGLLRITPPAYTGLAASSFPLDTNEIAAVEGATVTLDLTSNRPLGSASLTFTPAAMPGAPATPELIAGTLAAPHTASFTWVATRSGRLAATLRDIRGTPTPQPLELAFRALPDHPPEVALHAPPRLMLATPHSKIPVNGRADDDYALLKVQFVRTLSGFRDRTHVVAAALAGKGFDFAEQLDLEDLGLEPGQTIELMLDATDHNPSLLGQGSSEISRIQIISEDDYARYLRAKTTLAEFSARFRAAAEAVEQARKALEDLQRAAAKDDPEATAAAARAARLAHEKTADLLDRIAKDFPAYDLEKRLQELAEQQADDLRQNIEPLEQFDPNAPKPDQQDAITKMLDRLGRRQAQAAPLARDLEELRQAATLMEMAARFRQIYESQKSLAKRFGAIVEELRLGEDRNRRALPSLAETQTKNRHALDEFKTELRSRVEAMAPDARENLAPLVDSALKFLHELEVAAPETLMDAAAAHGKAGQANDAFANAELARALLERLMSEPEPFPQACMGQAPNFGIPRPDVNATLQQLLEGLLAQNPGQGGHAGGGGQAVGGFGGSGNTAPGFPMDLPVVGPQRMEFEPLTSESGHGGGKDGKTGPVPPLPTTAESGTLKPTASRQGDASVLTPETIPEPYREAVKRFLTP